MSELKDMPTVTVEQIVRFREKALHVESELESVSKVLAASGRMNLKAVEEITQLVAELETLRAQLAEAKAELNLLSNNKWMKLEVEHAELGAKVWSLQLRSGLTLEELYKNFDAVEARHQKEISDLHVQHRNEYQSLKAENEALRNVLATAKALSEKLPARRREGVMSDTTIKYSNPSVMQVQLYGYMPGTGMGNIIWPVHHKMRNGNFPKTHPLYTPTTKFADQISDHPSIVAFRERGYWASCFPEGDGITWKPLKEQTTEQTATDIRECFGWKVQVKRA